MSNALAVATVTATLANQLSRFIGNDKDTAGGNVPGARVTTLNPGSSALRDGDPLVNLYLYRVVRNGFTSNTDLPTRTAQGRALTPPVLMLELDYMITFFGDDARLEPQRLLGSVVAGLNAEPSLGRALIQATIAHTPWLAGSTLGDDATAIHLTPQSMRADVMSRVWSEFVSVPYQLTVMYTAASVALEVPQAIAPSRPVRRLGVEVRPSGPLPVRGIVNADQPDAPLVSGCRMAVRLPNPGQPGLRVLLNGYAAVGVSVGRDALGHAALIVPLTADQPAGLTVGTLTVQVELRGGADGRTLLAQSPPLPTPLLPAIDGTPAYDASSRAVTVRLVLPVPAGTAMALLLFPDGDPPGRPSLRLDAPATETTTGTVTFAADDAKPGAYLAMVDCGGRQSLLDYAGGRYTGPRMTVGGAA